MRQPLQNPLLNPSGQGISAERKTRLDKVNKLYVTRCFAENDASAGRSKLLT